MTLAMGFHYSIGGNKTGSGAFIDRLNAAGIPVMMKGASDAGLCFEAQEKGKQYGVENILIWRATSDREDRADYWLAPSVAAAKKWGEIQNLWPPELDKNLVWWEVVNEPRKIDAPGETQPTWGNMHTTAWLGLFMVEMAKLMIPAGHKLCGPSFSSGEPEPEDWQLEGMASWLRYCADNPTKAAISHHEYNYGSVPYSDNYPWHYGRFESIIAAADKLGIPRTFSIFLTEFGWTYQTVPSFEMVVPVLTEYMKLGAKFPQLKGVALWTLQSGWGGISDQLAQWISNDGNPLANWMINNQYPELPQPQATADEFGATLPNGNGDENMTVFPNFIGQIRGFGPDYNPKQIKYRILHNNGETNVYGPWITLPLPDYEDVRGIEMFVAVEEVETENPNPPSVIELPKGTLGVDVSAHQGVFDWGTVVASGVKFAIVRSSNGLGSSSTDSNSRDLQLKRNAAELTNLGIPWAIYHYLQPGQSISQQAALVNGILAELDIWGTFPIPGMINGRMLPSIFVDVEDSAITTAQVKEFIDALSLTAGIYTGKGVWDGISAGQDVWWSDVFLWCAAYGANDGKLPNWTSPGLPRGWFGIDIWQYTSLGGNEVGLPVDNLDLNSAGQYAPNINPPIPPPTLIDVAPYFVPTAQYSRKIVIKTGNGTQPMQLEKRPSDVILRKGDGNWIDGVRYQDSEQWKVEDGKIKKGKDTSDAGNGGRDGYDLGWAEWIPQFVEVGKTYHSTPIVKRFDRTNNCQVYSESQANDYLTIKAIIPTWISPANSSIVLNDVLVIEWRSGTSDLSVPPNEVYYFAKNIGYCGWNDNFIVEIAEGQAPLTGKLDCGM